MTSRLDITEPQQPAIHGRSCQSPTLINTSLCILQTVSPLFQT